MKTEPVCMLIVAVLLMGIAAAEMPFSFVTALNNLTGQMQSDSLSVANYQTGAGFTEDYSDFEYLQRETQVVTRAYDPRSGCSPYGLPPAGLEASVNSNVIGKAHIGWVSVDPVPDSKGRHRELGRSIEDLTGVFSIQKFIQLWSNSSPGQISVDWMPCV